VAEFQAVRTYSNLILAAATHKLQASTHNAEAINVLAFGRGPDVTNGEGALGLTVGVSSGNVSFSIHAGTAGRNGPGAARWVSGALACPSTGDQTVNLGATVVVQPGDWIGMSCDNTTATFRAAAPGIGSEVWMTGLVAFKDSSHPIVAGTPSGTLGRGERLVAIYGA
jgi:hypothetical protein